MIARWSLLLLLVTCVVGVAICLAVGAFVYAGLLIAASIVNGVALWSSPR